MRKLLKFFAGFVIIYIVIYAVLSLNGRYQPISTNLRGIEQYAWAPIGFYDPDHPWSGSIAARRSPENKAGGWNHVMMYAFAPLWVVDIHFIHENIDQ